MRAAHLIGLGFVMAMTVGSAAADDMAKDKMGDKMGGSMMTTMKGGEVAAIMPDGHMGTTMMQGDKLKSTINMASPLDHCMMVVTSEDGKAYMVDTSSDMAQQECEKIAK